jgi:hypothetical protein
MMIRTAKSHFMTIGYSLFKTMAWASWESAAKKSIIMLKKKDKEYDAGHLA